MAVDAKDPSPTRNSTIIRTPKPTAAMYILLYGSGYWACSYTAHQRWPLPPVANGLRTLFGENGLPYFP